MSPAHAAEHITVASSRQLTLSAMVLIAVTLALMTGFAFWSWRRRQGLASRRREAELALRRADAAGKIAGISQVNSATWSTQSTLVLSLAHSDGKDVALVTEACDMLSRYEELRYMRLQLEPPPGSNYRVRWRMCQ